MRLLFADRLPEQTLVELEGRGHDCVMEPGLTADDLPAAIAGFHGLVVRSTEVKRTAVLASRWRLRGGQTANGPRAAGGRARAASLTILDAAGGTAMTRARCGR